MDQETPPTIFQYELESYSLNNETGEVIAKVPAGGVNPVVGMLVTFTQLPGQFFHIESIAGNREAFFSADATDDVWLLACSPADMEMLESLTGDPVLDKIDEFIDLLQAIRARLTEVNEDDGTES